MAYVAIRSQIDSAMGVLQFPTKPVSVDGCTYDFKPSNHTVIINDVPDSSGSAFHHISFLWYTAFGSVITIVVSLLATTYFGKQDTSEVNPKLITPILRKYLKKYKYSSVALDLNKMPTEKDSHDIEEEKALQQQILEVY